MVLEHSSMPMHPTCAAMTRVAVSSSACLALAGAPGAVGMQEALDLLLRALRHVEPDPVARCAQPAARAQEHEILQIVEACRTPTPSDRTPLGKEVVLP